MDSFDSLRIYPWFEDSPSERLEASQLDPWPKGATRPMRFRRAHRSSRPGKGGTLVPDLQGLIFVAWTGRGGGRRGDSVSVAATQIPARRPARLSNARRLELYGVLGGELRAARRHWVKADGKVVGWSLMAGSSRALLRAREGRGRGFKGDEHAAEQCFATKAPSAI
jgi:hypothetical protein